MAAFLRLSYDDGRRFFVHAGIDPNKPLDAQHDTDLLWIREPFLSTAAIMDDSSSTATRR